MRLIRIGLVALVAVPFAVAASGGSAAGSRPHCTPAATPSVRLPVRLTARTGRGLFAIERDGRICRLSPDSLPVPDGAAWSSSGLWMKSEHEHVAVGRWRRTLWRSSGQVPHASSLGNVVLGRRQLAFSTYWRRSRLYVSALGGREHFVARGEFPLGWTSGSDLYVGRDQDGAILLRSGRRARRIEGADVRTAAYEPRNHSLYFVRRGRLVRARGDRARTVAGLAALGFRSERNLQLQVLGGLVSLQNKRRLVVLRPDGSLFASTLLPHWRRGWPWLTGQPTTGSAGVAFAVMHARTPHSSILYERGTETVYLLRPGSRAAVPVHRQLLRFNVCGHGAELAWHGHWLLYSTGEGPGALIDTSSGRAVTVTALVRRLPGFSGDDSGPFSLTWR